MMQLAQSPDADLTAERDTPTFRQALAVWLKIGCLSFGGPAGQIALMHRIVVDEKHWVGEPQFLHALNFCMLLPGPEAQQLATYIGWRLHGWRGGLAAGLLFIIPGALVMFGLSLLYVYARGVGVVDGALFGIKAAVLVIVVEAILRIGRRALKTPLLIGIAVAAFVAIFLLDAPFPLIVIVAALLGYGVSVRFPAQLAITAVTAAPALPPDDRWSRALKTTALWLAIWWLPVALAALLLGPTHLLVDLGTFFSKLAVVSFGGAYALMAYMAQEVVDARGWLVLPEMIDGLGLAETTPGPLILVSQFVGFLAAFRSPTPFTPLVAATLGAAITTWTIFAPSFLWIFAGAPFIEDLRGNRRLTGALAAITAAVVGVILNLAVWFALHVLFRRIAQVEFGPLRWLSIDLTSLDLAAAALALVAAVLAFGLHVGMIRIIAVVALLGAALRLAFAV